MFIVFGPTSQVRQRRIPEWPYPSPGGLLTHFWKWVQSSISLKIEITGVAGIKSCQKDGLKQLRVEDRLFRSQNKIFGLAKYAATRLIRFSQVAKISCFEIEKAYLLPWAVWGHLFDSFWYRPLPWFQFSDLSKFGLIFKSVSTNRLGMDMANQEYAFGALVRWVQKR